LSAQRNYAKIICKAEERWGLKEGAVFKATMLTHLKSKRMTTTTGKGNVHPVVPWN
jgi:hypothetical protein